MILILFNAVSSSASLGRLDAVTDATALSKSATVALSSLPPYRHHVAHISS